MARSLGGLSIVPQTDHFTDLDFDNEPKDRFAFGVIFFSKVQNGGKTSQKDLQRTPKGPPKSKNPFV